MHLPPSFLRVAGQLAAIGLLVSPVPGRAAETSAPAPAAVVRLDEFVTVGSRFEQRTVTASPVPIDILGRRELRQGGYTELAKVLQAQVPSFNQPHPTTPDGNTHVRSATLRGLSPDQTLVLVNGRRRHTSAWVNTGGTIGRGAVSTDLNAIPTTAIERVEVLRDGASAQYGSDAIAGVINIVLRDDLGTSAEGTYGVTREGDGDVWEASIASGGRLGPDGRWRTTLYYRDRNATNRALPDTRQFYFGTNAATGALVGNSGAFASGTTHPPAGVVLDPRESTVNRAVWRYGDADIVERTVFFDADLPLRPSGALTLYAFGGYGLSAATSNASFRRPADNNNVRAIYPNGFLPFVDTDSTNASLAAGLRGRAGTWDWDVSQSVGGNELEFFTHNTLNATYGASSPRSFFNGRLRFVQALTNLDLKTSADLGLPAPVRLAAGAEYRADRYRVGAGQEEAWANGGVRILDGPAAGAVATVGAQGFGGIQPRDAVRADRSSVSVYAEAETELAPAWRVSTALRFEDYSDFGTTLNGKVASRLEVGRGFAVRASASTGFHAPALAQRYFGSTSSRTDPNTNTIVLARLFPVGDPAARALGSTELRPEEAVTLAAGLAYEDEGFTVTADFYRIRIDDRIFLSSQFIGPAVRDYLASVGIPGVEGARFFTNAADTRTEGFDLTLRRRLALGGFGRLTLTGGYNHNRTRLERVAPTPGSVRALGIVQPLFDVTERIRVTRGQPRDNFQLTAAWDRGRFSALLRGVRYGAYEAVALTNLAPAQVALFPAGSRYRLLPTETVGAPAGNVDVVGTFRPKFVTDLDLGWRLTPAVTLSVGANNLLDVYPDEVIRSTPSRLGADAGGVFRYSEFNPFPYSGAFYYARLAVTF